MPWLTVQGQSIVTGRPDNGSLRQLITSYSGRKWITKVHLEFFLFMQPRILAQGMALSTLRMNFSASVNLVEIIPHR